MGKADQDAMLDAEPSSGAGMAISLARTLSGLALSTGRLQRAAVDYVKEVHPYLPVLLGKVRATGVVRRTVGAAVDSRNVLWVLL